MKRFAVYHAIFFSLFIYFNFPHIKNRDAQKQIQQLKQAATITCMPDREQLGKRADALDIPLMPGSGSYVWKINTTSDSAQIYFNQGINTYYGFHIIESLASFKKAARFDSLSPMIWWGQALAYGPNINDVGYSASPDALEAVRKALKFLEKASPAEQALIRAMELRYSEDSTASREILNKKYADAMKAVYARFPNETDVAALYADAMMLQHPWDLWNINGTPRQWTPRIREVLESALAKDSMHPGVHHYYIHIMEPSPYPEKAAKSADALGKITPGLAHLVHMPSHIYLRTGSFNKGVQINRDAVNRFKEYAALYPDVVNGAFIYLLHNQHMLANCAMHAGSYATAIEAANELQQSVDSATLNLPAPMGSLIQYMYMAPVLINTRFEKWDMLLQMPKPADRYVYANILYRFGRGMAFAAKDKIKEAGEESVQLQQLMKNEELKLPMTPFSSAIEGATTADALLKGAIALRQKKMNEAIAHFTTAAVTESKMVYNEPRDWFLNPHQYLGTAYMMAKNYKMAEEVFRKDLKVNNNNVWSLYRLQQALQKQLQSAEAGLTGGEFKKASELSDIDFATLYY